MIRELAASEPTSCFDLAPGHVMAGHLTARPVTANPVGSSNKLACRQTALRPVQHGAMILIILFGGLAPSMAVAQDPPQEAVNLFTEAANLQNQGEFDLAAEIWENFSQRFPNLELTHKAQHYLGVCRLQLKQIPTAKDAFAKVVASSTVEKPFPMLEDALLNLGWCYFTLGQDGQDADANFAAAEKTFRRLLETFENGKYADQAWYFLGESRYLQGNAKEAIPAYRSVIVDFPKSSLRSNAMYALGVAYEEASQSAEAADIYQQFLKDYPDSNLAGEIRLRTAEMTLQSGVRAEQANEEEDAQQKFAAAEREFAALAQNESFDQRDLALYKQAFCVYKRGEVQQAAALYANVTDQFPQSQYASSSSLSAGRFYYRLKEDKLAQRYLTPIAQGDTASSSEAAHWLCRIYLRQDEPQSAWTLATQAVSKPPESAEYTILLLLDQADAAYAIPERKAQATELYVDVAKLYPDSDQAAQGYYYAAFADFEAKRYDKAIQQTEAYLDRVSSSDLVPDVLSLKAESELQTQAYSEAEATLQRLLTVGKDRPEHPAWILRYALSLHLQEKSSEVLELLQAQASQLKTAEQRAEASYLAGAAHFRLEQFADAEKSLRESLQAKADWRQADETQLLLARTLFRQDQVNEAVAAVETMIATFSNSSRLTEAYYRLGEFQYAADQYAQAIEAYNRVLAADGNAFRPFALDGKAWSLFKSSDYGAAETAFTNLLDEFPDHSLAKQARYGRLVCMNQNNQYQQALDEVERYLADDLDANDRANGLFEQGLAYVGLKQPQQAAKTFATIIEDYSEFDRLDRALYELGWCYLDQQQPEQAAQPFARLVKDFPDSANAAEAQFHVAESLYRAKKYGEARDGYRKALSAAGNNAIGENAAYKLGWSLYHLADYEDAIGEFEKQVTQYPEGSLRLDGQFMIAECYYRQNEFEAAARRYQQIWPQMSESNQVDPSYQASTLLHGCQSSGQIKDWDNTIKFGQLFVDRFDDAREIPEAWLQIGRAYRGQDKLDEAIQALEKSALQSADEIGAHARFLIGEIYFGKKEYEEAQKQFRRVMLGYGGDDATSAVKLFQSMAAYEAGRCADVQIKDASGDDRTRFIDEAKKFYGDVVNKFGDSPYVEQARRRLQALSSN